MSHLKCEPWLVPDAILFLKFLLRYEHCEEAHVLETGSGGSTLFFAARAEAVISFEHSFKWFKIVKKEFELQKLAMTNVDLRFDPDYPKKGLRKIDVSFDIVLIDGRGRVRSILEAVDHINPGGYLILDNAERPRYSKAVKYLNAQFKERIVFAKDWTTVFWKINN